MTSVDTNVVFSSLNPEDTNHSRAKELLDSQGQVDALVLSPVVYAELMASQSRKLINEFLDQAGIEVVWDMPSEVWRRAGEMFGDYTRNRRQGRLPRRIMADFLIAAHAERHRLSLLTLDDEVFKYFRLPVIS